MADGKSGLRRDIRSGGIFFDADPVDYVPQWGCPRDTPRAKGDYEPNVPLDKMGPPAKAPTPDSIFAKVIKAGH